MTSVIANRIASNFTDANTQIIIVEDVVTSDDFVSNIVIDSPEKNLIVLVDNTIVLGGLDITITRNATPSSTVNSIANTITVANAVENILELENDKTLSIFHPNFEEYTLDSRLLQTSDTAGSISILKNQETALDNLFTIGGDSLLVVIESGTAPINITLKRDSYLSQLCPACPDKVCPTCPEQVCPPCETDETDDVKVCIGWSWAISGMSSLALLFVILIIVLLVLSIRSGKKSSSNGSTNNKSGIVNFGTTIKGSSDSMGVKLGKLKHFL